MPRIKKQHFEVSLGNGLGTAQTHIVLNVNSKGEFYCNVTPEIESFFEDRGHYTNDVTCGKDKNKKLTIYAPTLSALEGIVVEALRKCNEPEITEEYVIRYNIESHVSFAQTEHGDIYPNATFEGAKWHTMDSLARKMYGNHHAVSRNVGGFSLTIGAKALTKTTYVVGDKTSVTYKRFDKDGDAYKAGNPAELLNSWTGFDLPKEPKEISYSDEAAMFFHNLMLGMATISRQIQENTFDQEVLLNLISKSSGNFLMLPTAHHKQLDSK